MEIPRTSIADSRFNWSVMRALTWFVAILGCILAIQQFVVKYLGDHSAHTRTVAGVSFMLLGVVGLGLPMLLARYQRRFFALGWLGQRSLAFAVPLAYAALFAACMEASMRSTRLILPRPATPIAMVHYDEGGSRIKFGGRSRPYAGGSSVDMKNGVAEFSAVLRQGFLRFPGRETAKIVGQERAIENGLVEITLDVTAQEPIGFGAEGLADVHLEYGGSDLRPGERVSPGDYQVVVTGRPEK